MNLQGIRKMQNKASAVLVRCRACTRCGIPKQLSAFSSQAVWLVQDCAFLWWFSGSLSLLLTPDFPDEWFGHGKQGLRVNPGTGIWRVISVEQQ